MDNCPNCHDSHVKVAREGETIKAKCLNCGCHWACGNQERAVRIHV